MFWIGVGLVWISAYCQVRSRKHRSSSEHLNELASQIAPARA